MATLKIVFFINCLPRLALACYLFNPKIGCTFSNGQREQEEHIHTHNTRCERIAEEEDEEAEGHLGKVKGRNRPNLETGELGDLFLV